MKKGPSFFNIASVTLGFAFLYLPIVLRSSSWRPTTYCVARWS